MSGVALELRDDAPPRLATAQAMLERMSHRARDGRGTWTDSVAAIGFAAMWTTPEDVGESAPRVGPSGIVLAFDGRLDDRSGLASRLGIADEGPDARLALAAIERWWSEAPSRMIGDFAFIAWNPKERRALLGRDRLGQRPLFYAAHARGLRAASESRALLVDELIPIRADLDQLAFSLSEEYSETGATLLEGIRVVGPGCTVEFAHGGATERRYWDPIGIETVARSQAELVDALDAALGDAIRARLRRRGRFGVFVSGGLDSSLVAAMAAHATRSEHERPLLLTARFPDLACDESMFTDRLASHLGADLRSVVATDLDDPHRYAPPAHEDLQIDPFNNLYSQMGRQALTQGADVVLDGWGSDELQWWTGAEIEDALRARDPLAIACQTGLLENPLSRGAWLRLLLGSLRAGLEEPRWSRLVSLRNRATTWPDWMTDDARARIKRLRRVREDRFGLLEKRSRSQACAVQGLTESSQSPCGAGQRLLAAAATSYDLREPFADVRVVELLLSAPPHSRAEPFSGKPLTRAVAARYLPAVLAARRVPSTEFSAFFHRTALAFAAPLAGSGWTRALEGLGLVNPRGSSAFLDYAQTRPTATHGLFSLAAPEAWAREWLLGEPRKIAVNQAESAIDAAPE